MSKLILEQETHRILGACFEVYKEKGCGFVEPVYQECLEKEFALQGIEYSAQKEIKMTYKGTPLLQTFRADFLCFQKVIVELKSVSALADAHRSQVINYLRAAGLKVGLLVNFSHCPGIEYQRFVI